MSGGKHTPGPWEISRFEHGQAAIRSDEGYICTAYMASNGKAKANAHLIAAAPELYEALKSLLWRYRELVNNVGPGDDEYKTIQTAQTALRRARGESNE